MSSKGGITRAVEFAVGVVAIRFRPISVRWPHEGEDDLGGTHKRQISKPSTPDSQVSISANNHNRQRQRLGLARLG